MGGRPVSLFAVSELEARLLVLELSALERLCLFVGLHRALELPLLFSLPGSGGHHRELKPTVSRC